MNTVFIGRMDECGTKLCNHLSLTSKVIAMSDDKPQFESNCDFVYDTRNLNRVVQENEVDVIIFFENDRCDYSYINKLLSGLSGSFTGKLLYVHEKTPFRKKKEPTAIGKMICDEINRDFDIKTFFIEVSCLYGEHTFPSFLMESVAEINQKNSLTLSGSENEFCDFIHVDDFCVAINSILQKEPDSSVLQLQSGYPFPLRDLVELIKKEYKQASVLYSDSSEEYSYVPYCSEDLTQSHSFLKDVRQLINQIDIDNGNTSKKKVVLRFLGSAFLFAIAFFLIEVYTQFIAVSSELQFVDLRLLFVIVTALVFGKKMGVSAAVLCSIASISQGLLKEIKWYVLFYNIDNWIPLVIYFVAAIWIGTYMEKYRKPII